MTRRLSRSLLFRSAVAGSQAPNESSICSRTASSRCRGTALRESRRSNTSGPQGFRTDRKSPPSRATPGNPGSPKGSSAPRPTRSSRARRGKIFAALRKALQVEADTQNGKEVDREDGQVDRRKMYQTLWHEHCQGIVHRQDFTA